MMEEILPWIMNSYKHYYNIGDMNKIEYLNSLEVKDTLKIVN
jgi:hypothetical protein